MGSEVQEVFLKISKGASGEVVAKLDAGEAILADDSAPERIVTIEQPDTSWRSLL